MPIQILPPQLANQIAAGEVVERPASVVKELVENSLDAGATRIDIDIERGGSRLIRIRDNGSGIGKADLALALARHATSKISSLDDLEAIVSLGFRGEALASISAVSRLTMTSRTGAQTEAWQAYAEGREMAVTVKPAAHPVGSTVEVLDLFYNTPARRRFLRTEKTEFAHIDEVVRRIALARFDITLTLQHNGKTVRQYRALREGEARERRLGSICGLPFVQHALALSWHHDALAIHGWVAAPDGIAPSAELQYCYVNGRMMRDRLITHAIRQAYQDRLNAEQPPAYVLYLEMDPRQVDVNVHPAKHEVRFHQARLVHDFIYQAVMAVLQQAGAAQGVGEDGDDGGRALGAGECRVPENRASAGENRFQHPAAAGGADTSSRGKRSVSVPQMPAGDIFRRREGELYQRLLAVGGAETRGRASCAAEPVAVVCSTDSAPPIAENAPPEVSLGRVLSVCAGDVALTEGHRGLALVSLPQARRCLLRARLQPMDEALKAQPLLVPLRLSLDAEERQAVESHQPLLQQMGIRLSVERQYAQLHAVPLPLRQQNLPQLIPQMLRYLAGQSACETARLAEWLAAHWQETDGENWTVAQAVQLLADLERIDPQLVQSPPRGLFAPLDLQPAVTQLRQAGSLNE